MQLLTPADTPAAPQSLAACLFFFFNDTATTEIYTLSLHDALPIFIGDRTEELTFGRRAHLGHGCHGEGARSEEHTSELQSRLHLVCRLLLEKKKTKFNYGIDATSISLGEVNIRKRVIIGTASSCKF